LNLFIAATCREHHKSGARRDGIYTIDPDGQGPFKVRCDMTTDGGGWTVIQRRMDGSQYFYLGWSSYKNGFGDLNGEYWLGLDKIHRLSVTGYQWLLSLRVDLEDFNGDKAYAKYRRFAVFGESSKYQLTVGGYTGKFKIVLK
jgi:ficolin